MTEVRRSFGFPLSVAVLSDVGRVRTNNEDAWGQAWLEDGSLFIHVADGMGGHEAGEVASSLAVRVVEDVVSADVEADPRERLYNGLLEANTAILEEAESSGTKGMGTTSIVAILKGNEAYVAQIGDSRCFHVRKGHLIWRSKDHTRVQMLVDQGEISEEEARNHPEAGMLTRALGHGRMADGRPLIPDVMADPLILEPGDSLVFSSDGLHDLVEDWEVAQAVASKTAEEATEILVDMACDRGGHDNVTVAVVNAGPKAAPYDPDFQANWPPAPEVEEAEVTYSDFDEDAPAPPVVAPVSEPPAPEPEGKSNKALILGGVAVVVVVVVVLLLAVLGAVLYFVVL